MADPFDILQIDPTQDRALIKRAYARLLKIYRPDEDPEGFQQLHEAYQAALQYASDNRESPPLTMGDPPLTATIIPFEPPQGESSREQASSSVKSRNDWEAMMEESADFTIEPPPLPPNLPNFSQFYEEFCQQITPEKRPHLQQWLTQQMALWPIDFKQQLGEMLYQQITADHLPLHEEDFEIVAQALHLYDQRAPHHLAMMITLSERLHEAWILRYDPHHYDRQIEQAIGSPFFKQLQQPFRWSHFLFQSFPPWRAYRRANALHTLKAEIKPHHPTSLNPKQIRAWLSLIQRDQRFPPARILVQIHQLILLLLATPLLVSLISGFFGESFLFDPTILYHLKDKSIKVVMVILVIAVTLPRRELSPRRYFKIQRTIRTLAGLLSLIFLYSTYQLSYYQHHLAQSPQPTVQNIVDQIAGANHPFPSDEKQAQLWEEALEVQAHFPDDTLLNQLLLLYNANNRDERVMNTTYYLLKDRVRAPQYQLNHPHSFEEVPNEEDERD